MCLLLQDYTLFEPANNAYSLSDPTKWQPLVIEPVPPYSGGGATALTGAPYVQHHITPQVRMGSLWHAASGGPCVLTAPRPAVGCCTRRLNTQ